MVSEQATDAPAAPAVFRTPRSALVAVVFLALCLSPIAFGGGPWFLLFLVPVAIAGWVLWTRTVVDADGLHVRTVLGSTSWPWSRVTTLRLVDRGWVRAVGTGDPPEELTLRGVRIRDLGRVGEASGGRIAAPSPAEAAAAVEHARELEAARMRVDRLREQVGEPAAAETPDTPAAGTPGADVEDDDTPRRTASTGRGPDTDAQGTDADDADADADDAAESGPAVGR